MISFWKLYLVDQQKWLVDYNLDLSTSSVGKSTNTAYSKKQKVDICVCVWKDLVDYIEE